ncbi:MAG TPA: sugar transferase, partial [Candidatus Gracilibacteria bacterium]|nr:sugar transferase [Candidatus Gracilibacteria bacterium]
MSRLTIFISLSKLISDFIISFLISWLAYFLRPITDLIPFVQIPFASNLLIPPANYFVLSFFISAMFVIFMAVNGNYQINNGFKNKFSFFRLLLSVFYLILAIISYYSLILTQNFFSRGILLMIAILTIIFISINHGFWYFIQNWCWKKGKSQINIAIIGENERISAFQKNLNRYPAFQVKYTKKKSEIHEIDSKEIQEVWVFADTKQHYGDREILDWAQNNHLIFRTVPDLWETLTARMEADTLDSWPILSIKPTPLEGWGRVLKRLSDICFAGFGIILISPILLFIAILVKLTSKGPIFYISERVGRYGKTFKMLKFRSMIVDADQLKAKLEEYNHRKDSPLFKIKNDPRITPFGNILRKTSLDELPQLFNVLWGTMSLVGPRAHLPQEVAKYDEDQLRVLTIKPGITGLPQVSGRSD